MIYVPGSKSIFFIIFVIAVTGLFILNNKILEKKHELIKNIREYEIIINELVNENRQISEEFAS